MRIVTCACGELKLGLRNYLLQSSTLYNTTSASRYKLNSRFEDLLLRALREVSGKEHTVFFFHAKSGTTGNIILLAQQRGKLAFLWLRIESLLAR